MSGTTKVYLITGFLGSGKTTLLNRFIKQFPPDRKLMILMNEFGEVGVDGTLVENEDLEMLEISKGSIFCACVKTDFVKGLYAISKEIRPDILFIESTGVANPSDLKKDLKLPIFSNRFEFKEQICMIDAAHFLGAYGAFQSIDKQLASSTLFLLNKIDQADRPTIERIKDVVKRHRPDPVIYETTYANIDLSGLVFSEEVQEAASDLVSEVLMTPEEVEAYAESLLSDPASEVTPPDRLLSAVYRWEGNTVEQFKELVARIPKAVVRSKGFLESQGETLLFSYVMGDWELAPRKIPPERSYQKNLIVFIGPPEAMQDLEKMVPQTGMSPSPVLVQ